MKKVEENILKLMDYLKGYVEKNGFPPSYREIGKALDIKSTNSVKNYMDILEQRGFITKSSSKNRSIKINNTSYDDSTTVYDSPLSKDLQVLPVVGQIAAGIPILAQENITDQIVISSKFFNTSETIFMLKVKGNSMIDADIHDGDYIIVKQQNVAENGDIVVALIDGYSTVKTFYKEKNTIRLQPQNQLFQPIYSREVEVLGVVIGLIRKF